MTIFLRAYLEKVIVISSMIGLLVALSLASMAAAHDQPFKQEPDGVRKIPVESHFQWKVDNQTKFKGRYQHNNVYHDSQSQRGKRDTIKEHESYCSVDFIATPIYAPNNRLRKIGKHDIVNNSGYLALKLSRLKCQLDNNDGQAYFETAIDAPHAARIKAINNNQTAHARLKKYVDRVTKWWSRSYVIHAKTNANSHIYRYKGAWSDGDLILDKGLFNGAFINFAKPRGRGPEHPSHDISRLQIPDTLFMDRDDVFGPNRVPAPASTASVRSVAKANGAREYISRQSYYWEDSSVGSQGAETVATLFELVPASDLGYVHRATWSASVSYDKRSANSVRKYKRRTSKKFHLQVE